MRVQGFEGEIHSQDRVCMMYCLLLEQYVPYSDNCSWHCCLHYIMSSDDLINWRDLFSVGAVSFSKSLSLLMDLFSFKVRFVALLPSVHNIYMSHVRDLLKVKHESVFTYCHPENILAGRYQLNFFTDLYLTEWRTFQGNIQLLSAAKVAKPIGIEM